MTAAEPVPGPPGGRRLRTAPGLEVVDTSAGLLLASATSTLRLAGGVADVVRDRLLPALATTPTAGQVVQALDDLPGEEVGRIVERLVAAGVVQELPDDPGVTVPSWLELVSANLDDRLRYARRLAGLRIGLVGTGAASHVVRDALARAGYGDVAVVDPSAGSGTATEAAVTDALVGAAVVVTVVPAELAAVRIWANRASLAADVPSVHVLLDGPDGFVGPLVVPGEGACYLCWRMRALACADDFSVAMAREESLDRSRRAADPPRPVLPGLAEAAASVLVHELTALTLAIGSPRLTGHVLHLHGLEGTEALHPVLQRPDCPACEKKDRPPRADPSLAELAGAPGRETDFDTIMRRAVSEDCGVVRRLDRVAKDIREPELPVIVRAELANARFDPHDHGFVGCSGKGLDLRSARDTALGEALERYAALTWQPAERVRGRRADVPGATLDPAELVLFAPEQYGQLPYAPYSADSVLDWVPATSLAHGGRVWVPLLAAHLGYNPPDEAGHLFQATSNGFAAGPTLPFAVERALLEVVERDAFLIAWSHRLAGTRHDALSVPDETVRAICGVYARRGVRFDVHLLPTDSAASVALALGWSDEEPAVVVGLGAALDPVDAARGAVLEVAQVRPALRARLRQPATRDLLAQLVADPSRVRELEDHDLRFADHRVAREEMGFLLAEDVTPWPSSAPDTVTPDRGDLTRLVASLARVAPDVLYLDVTPPDVGGLGVSVAKAIVPGFQPIHFGAGEMRLGHPRLLRMPVDLGLRAVSGLDELNLEPHPVA